MRGVFYLYLSHRAFSSVVEHFIHIERVAGPIPATRTISYSSAPTDSRGADRSVGLVTVLNERYV